MELYEHNLRPYEELKKLGAGDASIYVTATGTGKSYVAGKLIEDSDKRVLVVTPRRSICKTLRNIWLCKVTKVEV